MVIKDIFKTNCSVKEVSIPIISLKNGADLSKLKNNIIVGNDINEFTFIFNLNGDITDLKKGNLIFNISVYRDFIPEKIYEINNLSWNDISNNTYQLTLPINKLQLDGEFIFKINFTVLKYNNEVLENEFGFFLEDSSNKYEGIFNHYDQYISVSYDLPEPILYINEEKSSQPEILRSYQLVTETSTTSILMQYKYIGNILLSLNGSTMSEGLDYEINNGIITFKDTLPKGTVINITYTGSDAISGLTKENFLIDTTQNLKLKKEGDFFIKNKKYAICLSQPISKDNTPIVVINGVILSEKLDFYIDDDFQTIVFNGNLIMYDVIDIYYVSEFTTLNNVNSIKGYISNNYTTGNEVGFHDVKISPKNDLSYKSDGIRIPFEKGLLVYDFKIDVENSGIYYVTVFSTKKLKNGDEIVKKSNTLKINITK